MRSKICFKSLCAIGLLFVIAAVPARQAHADGFWDFFFPPVDNMPDPSKTLRAPFADEDAVIEDLDASRTNASPLQLRHRTNAVMSRWVELVIPDLLSYQTNRYESQYREKIKHFGKTGAKEYVNFLNKQSILSSLKSGRYNVSGFVSNYPVVIAEDSVDGRYRWVFRADAMITFMQSDLEGYGALGADKTVSREYTLTFQLGRSRGAENEHGVLIETWDAKLKQ